MINKTDSYRTLFQQKKYDEITALFSADRNIVIHTDDDAEFMSILGFSFYNTHQYENAILAAKKVLAFIKNRNEINDASDLWNSLVTVIFDSYIKLNRRTRAHFFLKRNIRKECNQELNQRYVNSKNHIADLLISLLNWFLPVLAISLVGIQKLTSVFSIRIYISIIIILLLMLITFFLYKNRIREQLLRLL